MTADLKEHTAEKQVPHNLEAEIGVIGSLLLYPERLDLIRGLVSAEDFFSEQYRIVFQTITDMSDASQPIDDLTLREELNKRKQLDIIGGAAALAELSSSVPNSANLSYYAKILRDKAILRKLIRAATGILDEAYTAKQAAEEVLDWSEHQIYAVAEHGSLREVLSFKDVLKGTMHDLEVLASRSGDGTTTGLATDYHQLDHYTGGLQKSELIVIAGRPSMGKSTFALNVVSKVAIEQKIPCAFFSLEMSKENIARNMLCAYSRIPGQHLRNGRLRDDEWGKLALAAGEMSQAPLFIDDTPGLSLGELRGKCRRLKRAHNIALVAVDYMQLMRGPIRSRDANRQQEISEISRGLKELARELDLPVMALSQLNRGVEDRADHKPMLSDLRESGAIEQDADLVMLLHRPSYYTQDETDNEAQIIIAKQRNGPTGTVKLVFINEIMRFENLSLHQDEEYS